MNEEALKYSFELFQKDGYSGTFNDYVNLINSNPEALNYSHDLFLKDGFEGSLSDFSSLVGVKKKDEPVVSTSPEGGTDFTTQEQKDLGSLGSSQVGSEEQIAGIQAYFERRDLDADEVNRDPNIQAAIKSGVISEQDLIDAGYKQPEQVDVLSQPNEQRVQYAKNKISALRIKTQEEMDFATQQRRLDTPYAYEGSASEDTFVDDLYDSSLLASMKINPKDFDGFLEERGFKKDFIDKQERGLFQRTYGTGGDAALAFEAEKMRMLNLYVSDQLERDINWQKIQAQKETGINPDFEGKRFMPSQNNVDLNKLTEYVENEMPLITQKLKERDVKNRETYIKHINGEMGVGNFISNLGSEGWKGFSDRVNELSASFYGFVGDKTGLDYFSNISDATRLAVDTDKLLRTDNLSYGYASGKTTEYDGRKYLVDENNQVYDLESKIRVTQFLDEGTYKEIVSKAKSLGYDDQTFSATGTAYQTANVVGDLVVQIALTRGAGTTMAAAGGFTRGLGVLSKTKNLLKAVPMSREMSSAIIAQATMGASSGYERTLRLAKDAGLNENQARELATYSSSQMALLYALTAPISPQTKATEAMFGKIRNVAIKDAVEAYKNLGREGVIGVFEKYGKMALNYGGEGLKEVFQENVQQAGEAFVVNANVNQEAGQEIARDTITMDEFINTSIISFLAGGLMPAAGSTVDAARKNTRRMLGLEGIDRMKALDYLSRNEQKVVDLLNDQVGKGVYTMDAATDLLSEINTYKEGIGKIPTDLKPETALEIMGEIEQIRALEAKRDQLDPMFHDGINQQIEQVRESIKKKVDQDAIQEQEARDIPDAQPAEGVQEVEEEVREPFVTERKPQTVSDLINRPVTLTELGGSKLDTPIEGEMYVEGQQVVVEDANGNITEVGNVDEISSSTLEEMGIVQQESEIKTDSQGNIQFGEQTLVPDRKGIKKNKRGDVSRVVLRSPDGSQTVTLRGANAEEAAYQILLKEAQSPEQEQRINELLDQDEEFQDELRQVEAAPQAEADQDIEQAVEQDEDYSKRPIVVRSRPKTATEEPVVLSGVEAEAADRTIEKIVNDGIAKGQSTQEILDRILPRYAFNDLEINNLRDFIEGKRSGKTKTDFAAYKKGAPVTEQEVMTEPATIENAPEGTYLNVGMIEGKDGREMTEDEIESALPKGVEIQEKTRLEIGEGVEEPTLSLRVSRPLTPAEMKAFRTATGQMAVPQMTDGVGTMYGTTDWGPFNPEFFIMPSKEKLSDIVKLEGEVQKLRDIFKAPDVKSQVEAAEKALSKVAPSVKIVVHKDEDSYAKATGEQDAEIKSRGEYNSKTKTIHINPAKANARTVAHEAFHAILLNIIGTDAEVQRITKAMIKSVAKSASPELKAALDNFAANYDENIQSEEKLAELVGMIAANHATLPKPTQNVIKRWMDRLAKMFGLKPFTDTEVVDVLNVIGKKIAAGEAISEKDISIIDRREISDRTARMSRKQLQDLFLSDEKPNLKSTKDVAKFLDAWTKESAVFEDDVKNISDREIVDRFVDHLTLELQAWEKVRKDDYISFYDEDVVKNTNPTLQQYAKKEYGRELTDTEVKLYHLVSSFASPSANPEMDSWKGFDIFDRFMKTGELSGYSDKVATVWKTLPGGKRVDTGVPRVDEKGMPVRSKVTPAYSQTGLDKFNLLIEKMGGDIDAAMDWITSRHTYDEIADMFGYPKNGAKAMKENEYMSKEDGGIGVFGMTGAKLGSYILNRFGNFSTVTKDMWYARTMARLSGEDLVSVNKATGKEGAIKTPWSESTKQGRRMRSLADQAFKKVGDLFDTSPAMVQERIWDFEKRLYEMLGANEDAAYTSDGLKKGIERAKDVTTKKQVSSADEVIKTAKDKGISDAAIRKFLTEDGMTIAEADFAVKKYNQKIIAERQKGEGIRVINNNVVKKLDQVLKFVTSARGYMPKSMQVSKETKNGFIEGNTKRAMNTLRRLEKAVGNYKGDKVALTKDIDAMLRGVPQPSLPENIQEIVGQMRAHIDALSKSLIESGAVSDIQFDELSKQRQNELIKQYGSEEEARLNYTTAKDNVLNNMGSYLTRSYEVYSSKNWKSKVAQETIDKARNYLKEQMRDAAEKQAEEENRDVDAVLEENVDAVVTRLLDRDQAKEFIQNANDASKRIGILRQRKDIPAELRALMGEYTAPAQNYIVSVNKVASLVAQQKFLNEMKAVGEGVFFFSDDKTDGFKTRIAAEGSETMNPLDGMYTSPEIADALKGSSLININIGPFQAVVDLYLKAVGLVKYNKTILSPGTHAKNFFGNMFFMLANGYLDPKDFFTATKVVGNDLFGASNKKLNEKLIEYIEAGIINQSATLRDLKDMMSGKEAKVDNMEQFERRMIGRFNKPTWTKIKEKPEKWYQAEDDFFKIVAYESNKQRYAQALHGKPFEQLNQTQQTEVTDRVKEIVKNTLPNYDRLPEVRRLMRALPLTGTFISFHIEAIRTAYNTLAITTQELNDPKTRAIGIKRLSGILSLIGLKVFVLSSLGVGDDDDEMESIVRTFLPPWSTNSNIVIEQAKDGVIKYRDLSASDPWGVVDRSIIGYMSGKTELEGFINSIKEVAGPFVEKDILLSAISDGYNKVDESQTFDQNADIILKELYRVLSPGALTSGERILLDDKQSFVDIAMGQKARQRTEGLTNEFVGQVSGYKSRTIDINQAIYFKFRDIASAGFGKSNPGSARLAASFYNKKYYEYQKNLVGKAELDDAYNKSNAEYQKEIMKATMYYESALKLGVPVAEIRKQMVSAGFSAKEIRAIRGGFLPDLKRK
jgi:hypothetical protein